jgi:hypothetical protein
MTVKLKDVAITYNLGFNKQIDSKQLFYGYSEIYNCYIYISYNTIVAINHNGQWHLTGEKFSRTTSSHMTTIRRLESQCIVNNDFNKLLQGIRVDNLLIK